MSFVIGASMHAIASSRETDVESMKLDEMHACYRFRILSDIDKKVMHGSLEGFETQENFFCCPLTTCAVLT